MLRDRDRRSARARADAEMSIREAKLVRLRVIRAVVEVNALGAGWRDERQRGELLVGHALGFPDNCGLLAPLA